MGSAVMQSPGYLWVYFVYGLAFFSMGLAILLEISHGSETHLRTALRPLAAFGLLHGLHEWLEMFSAMGHLPMQRELGLLWDGIRLGLLAFSFLSLTAFGAALLSQKPWWRRASLLLPLTQAAIWGVGVLVLRSKFAPGATLLGAGEAWTRYLLGVPSALIASGGLIMQQRAFRQAGMVKFGQDSLWAAVGFAWYGAVGQVFVRASALAPSNVINDAAFLRVVGVPIQFVRAGAAVVASVFVMRFLRAFEVEVQRQLQELRTARLREAERRQALRGELLRRVVSAQEAERKRVARELHDDTGQALTAIGLGLRAVSRALQQNSSKAVDNLGQLESLVDRSLDDLQRLIADLRPSHLDDLGLPAALRWYGNELEDRTDLEIEFNLEGEPRPIEPPMNTALFRVAQEALTNVIKHADASKVVLHLTYLPQAVSLQVTDDGRGFDMSSLAAKGRTSWGLLGMEERASLLGGDLAMESSIGKGTCIRVTIPNQSSAKEGSDGNEAATGG
jgi:signal transduction histidine kinase